MQFRILGPVEVWRDGEHLPVAGPKQRALLAILLMHRNRVVAAERLIELLWGDDSPDTASHSLQVHVSQLRKLLPPKMLDSRPPGYVLHAADDQVDASQFESRVAKANQLRQAGDLNGAVQTLREALSLWRGEPLADVATAPFAIAEVARLTELRLRAIEERLEAELALGRHGDLLPELEALVAEHPLRERLCAQLMLALYQSGRQAEASDVYYRTRKRLVDELGMEPGPTLQALLKDIVRQDPKLAQLPAAPAPPRPASKLPHPLTSFIGRRTEVIVITRLLADHRLVTLTGPGGIGKTRLAIEVAEQMLKERQTPVYFIDLALLADPGLVPQTIASVVGAQEHPTRSVLETLVEFLTTSHALLLLDNCEHVLVAAATATELILRDCPNVHVLSTSRERLNIPGERVWPISPLRAPDPLQLPSVQDLARFEAIQLFAERARALQPSFVLVDETALAVARICHSLDGMPLALELAAAQISLLSPEQIVSRLGDRLRLLGGGSRTGPARHQTLQATIEWSHNLLNPDEQRLFRRLSVFAGSFSLEAVEAVCADADDGVGTTLPTLRRLVDASLVQSEEGRAARRCRMLETLRQYSRERLLESGELDSVSPRLVAYLTNLARDGEDKARGPDSVQWLARMEEDHDNVRVALDWSTSRDLESGLRLALAWVPFWIARGFVREGYERLAPEHRKGVADDALRARTLAALGRLALFQGQDGIGLPLLEEAVPLLRRHGLAEDLINALLNLSLAGHTPNFQYLQEALAAAKERGKPELTAAALVHAAEAAAMQGELKTARRLFQESLQIGGEAQSLWVMAAVLSGLGTIDAREGDLGSASWRLRESLSVSRRRDDKLTIGGILLCLASLAVLEGQPDRALRLAGAVESLRQSLGINRIRAPFWYEREIDTNLQNAKVLLGQAAPATLDQGRQMTIERAIEYALSERLEAPELVSLPR